eukprot:gnl/TRDRNA2_/TRDRNA2_41008_c0_seq1.p1 gnl/TRDRNA2_/TRDRNA2_41008_c0~~gnl/TRDRNA2_/TRDRNA2_41008_c0_seq1.p1  ORF type:complete len:306 (-),score=57.42 gnl/TRDRNA2_/TRDRNA2_41008_c0_seq1:65-982(-)
MVSDQQSSGLPVQRLATLSLPAALLSGGAGVNNSGDDLATDVPPGGKLLWLFRHGQSTGNVAKEAARAADRKAWELDPTAAPTAEMRYISSTDYIDAPLTELGLEQARAARLQIAAWALKPTLIVASPLTRAIQTAAIVFEDLLKSGSAQLVIRPELREFFPDNNENSGRTLQELRRCQLLQALARWADVKLALSDEAVAEWGEAWDAGWADGAGAWQAHCGDPARLANLSAWLEQQPASRVVMVCHWGTINNFLNRQPWADHLPREEVQERWGRAMWPLGGLARTFHMQNCGWVAVIMSPTDRP